MNTKLTIKNKLGEVLQTVIFTNQVALENFKQVLHNGEPWGKPEHTVILKEAYEIEHPAIEAVLYQAAVLDANGVVVSPEVLAVTAKASYIEKVPEVTQLIPSEYVVIAEDITLQVNQAKINAESEAFLISTDWMIIRELEGTPCSAIIKTQRTAARLKIVR